MNIMKKLLVLGILAFVASVSSVQVQAQGRGNFDPEQFRQRMMDRYRETLGVKDDAEWKAISERINKVMEARRDVGFGGGGGFGRGPRRGGDNANGGNDQAAGGGRRGFGGEPSPEAEALQKALDSNASADDIKAKLAKYRDSRKEKRAKLEKAQQDLKEVLTAKQEAAAVLGGLLE
jgi:Spy/CpxP family protein refolding chaperone